jgi:hypothetical protein
LASDQSRTPSLLLSYCGPDRRHGQLKAKTQYIEEFHGMRVQALGMEMDLSQAMGDQR